MIFLLCFESSQLTYPTITPNLDGQCLSLHITTNGLYFYSK
jgi:hypothetical protein